MSEIAESPKPKARPAAPTNPPQTSSGQTSAAPCSQMNTGMLVT